MQPLAPLRCLIIEDEPRVSRFVSQGLSELGHTVVTARTGDEGLRLANEQTFSVFIVDLGLPGGLDGFGVVEGLRRQGHTEPILILTASDTTRDVVRSFDVGADDYVTKPFDFLQFEARLRALVRRAVRSDRQVSRFGALELDRRGRLATIDGKDLDLTPTEFSLLEFLVSRAHRTVTRDEVLAAVWEMDFDPGTRLIDVHVSNLRKKLEAGGHPRIVATVRGRGFRAVKDGS